MMTGFAVFFGGGLGSFARFGLAYVFGRFTLTFSGILAVNIIGCFAAGLLTGLFHAKSDLSDLMRVFLITGFLGGFTTFSAFSLETLQFIQRGDTASAGLYVLLSVAGSILMSAAGFYIGKSF